jgi:hypothetical protein
MYIEAKERDKKERERDMGMVYVCMGGQVLLLFM